MPIINPININDFSNGSLVHNRTTATLASANWVDNSGVYTQTISVPNMTSTATVWVSPQYDATTNYTQMYATDQIVPIEQGADYITFRRYAASSSGDIEINVVWVEQGASDSQTVVLASADWVSGQQTKSIPSISASSYVWVSPDDTVSNIENYCNAQIYCSNQVNGALTFTYAGTLPTVDIPVNVAWMDMVAHSTPSSGGVLVIPVTLSNSNVVFSNGYTIADIYNAVVAGNIVKILYEEGGEYLYFDITAVSYNSNNQKYSIDGMTAFDINSTSSTISILGFRLNDVNGSDISFSEDELIGGDVSFT